MSIYDIDLTYPTAPPTVDEHLLEGMVIKVDGSAPLAIVQADPAVPATHPDAWGGARDSFIEPVVAPRLPRLGIDSRIRDRAPAQVVVDVRLEHVGLLVDPAVIAAGARLDGNLDKQRAIGTLTPVIGLGAPPPASGQAIKVAVIDREFSQYNLVDQQRTAAVNVVDPTGTVSGNQQTSPGHGTAMAQTIMQLSNATILPYQLGRNSAAAYDYVGSTQLAMAIATACADGADIILLARNWTINGSPRHLRQVMHSAATSGRGSKGVLIVCSSGDLFQTVPNSTSYGLPADDAICQPWAMVVGPASEIGAWGRRNHIPLGRIGPSIDICAPSGQVSVAFNPDTTALVDDTSSASALVAVVATHMLDANRDLTVEQLRVALCATAYRPPNPDATGAADPAANGCNNRDRLGHNFKVGYGLVDAGRAVLSVRDPVCAAFILAGENQLPYEHPEAGLILARAWDAAITASTNGLVERYRKDWALLFARMLLDTPSLQRAILWCARHLVELTRSPPLTWRGRNHSAFVQRVLVALWDFVDAIGTPGAVTFAQDVERAILSDDGAAVSRFIESLVPAAAQ